MGDREAFMISLVSESHEDAAHLYPDLRQARYIFFKLLLRALRVLRGKIKLCLSALNKEVDYVVYFKYGSSII